METLDLLRRQIDTTEDLQTIVRTMKALSAVSVRQYERAQTALAEYNRTVALGLYALLKEPAPPTGGTRRQEPSRAGWVVMGSDHGLCGRFNEDLCHEVATDIQQHRKTGGTARLLVVGDRAGAHLEALGYPPETILMTPSAASAITTTVTELLIQLDQWQQAAKLDTVWLFHNRRTASSVHFPTRIPLLPVDPAHLREIAGNRWPSRRIPTHTLPAERLLSALIREFLFVSLFRACAESLASEHNSRLAAMYAAEKNIQERLEELGARYRQQRQQAITAELLDVTSGFEVLSDDTDRRLG
ncbi:MAG: F0F1 ATP synthase subunit gamma [Pseudomonadota bacterium]|nr:F0F1 ATP synthase subunit gamma [Pseudomonadota bacterium]